MDNRTLERRLKAKDKLIAELLEALIGITEQAETVLDLLDKHDAVKKPCKKAYEIRRGQLAYTIEHAEKAIRKAKEKG